MRKSTFVSRLLSGVACALLLFAVGPMSYGAAPYRVSPPSGKQWTMTFEDDFTKDKSIDTNKWNGGAGGTDWATLDFHGKAGGAYMFNEGSDPSGQHYDGCTLSSANGLEMRSSGAPSAALQTGGMTAKRAKFMQKFGYWEARFKLPHNTHGEGKGLHTDFWMHPIPEGVGSPTEWLPEINVGERPTWDANLDKANNKIFFIIHDYGDNGARKDNAYGGPYGTSPLTDLSADWHTYGLYWRDDGSGPYGSMQFYLDGKPLDKPYTLSSKATNMANGIYIFLSLDNDNKGADWTNNPWMIQYVRVWRLDPKPIVGRGPQAAATGPNLMADASFESMDARVFALDAPFRVAADPHAHSGKADVQATLSRSGKRM